MNDNPYAQLYFDVSKEKISYVPSVMSEETLLKDFVKYYKPHITPPAEVGIGIMMTNRFFRKFIKQWKPVDYEHAILELDYSTSPGFPWNLFFEKADLVQNPIFREYYKSYWKSLSTKYPKSVIFNISQKEELRHVDKVLAGKTRSICAAPMEHTIACVQMFKGFMDQFLDYNLEMKHLGGFTPYYGGWNELIRRLKRYNKCNGYDFGQYDSSIREFFFDGFSDLLCSYLHGDEAKMRARNLITQACESVVVLPDGSIVTKDFGNATGWYFTFVFNVYVNMVLNLAFFSVKFSTFNLDDYDAFLVQIFCGDDNATSWEDDRFVPSDFVSFCSQLGMTCDLDHPTHVRPEQLVFVSRHTVRWRNMWVSHGNVDKMTGAMFQCFKGDHYSAVLIKLCAIRRDMFFCKPFFEKITGFIQYLFDYFKHYRNEPAYKLALSNFENDSQLLFLHTGVKTYTY